jgi:hypothetical protein
VTDRGHPDVLEVVRSQRWEDVGVDRMVEKRPFVLVEPKFPEPGRDIHRDPR